MEEKSTHSINTKEESDKSNIASLTTNNNEKKTQNIALKLKENATSFFKQMKNGCFRDYCYNPYCAKSSCTIFLI